MTDEGQQEDQEMRQIRISSRPVVASALVALLVAALVPAVAGAHTPPFVPIKFSVSIGGECIYGTASDGASVRLTLKSAGGSLKERATVESASESGYFEHCSSDGDVVQIGDRIRAFDGTSEHLLVVPELSLVINRVDDFFKGRAPAGDYVRLTAHYGWEFSGPSWRIRANSQGMWGYKPQFGVTGQQGVSLTWKSDANDVVGIRAQGPHVDVTIGSAVVRGSTRANGIATVVLRRAGSNNVAATAVTRAGPDGLFQTKFRNGAGNLVKVRVGDRITSDVSPDVDLIVPNVTLNLDAESGQATGTCTETTSIITVRVIRNGYSDGSTEFPEDDFGSFEADLSDLGLVPGETVTVTCFWEGDGDLVGRQVIVQ